MINKKNFEASFRNIFKRDKKLIDGVLSSWGFFFEKISQENNVIREKKIEL